MSPGVTLTRNQFMMVLKEHMRAAAGAPPPLLAAAPGGGGGGGGGGVGGDSSSSSYFALATWSLGSEIEAGGAAAGGGGGGGTAAGSAREIEAWVGGEGTDPKGTEIGALDSIPLLSEALGPSSSNYLVEPAAAMAAGGAGGAGGGRGRGGWGAGALSPAQQASVRKRWARAVALVTGVTVGDTIGDRMGVTSDYSGVSSGTLAEVSVAGPGAATEAADAVTSQSKWEVSPEPGAEVTPAAAAVSLTGGGWSRAGSRTGPAYDNPRRKVLPSLPELVAQVMANHRAAATVTSSGDTCVTCDTDVVTPGDNHARAHQNEAGALGRVQEERLRARRQLNGSAAMGAAAEGAEGSNGAGPSQLPLASVVKERDVELGDGRGEKLRYSHLHQQQNQQQQHHDQQREQQSVTGSLTSGSDHGLAEKRQQHGSVRNGLLRRRGRGSMAAAAGGGGGRRGHGVVGGKVLPSVWQQVVVVVQRSGRKWVNARDVIVTDVLLTAVLASVLGAAQVRGRWGGGGAGRGSLGHGEEGAGGGGGDQAEDSSAGQCVGSSSGERGKGEGGGGRRAGEGKKRVWVRVRVRVGGVDEAEDRDGVRRA